MAVIINGEGITLDEFNAELDRYLTSQGGESALERQSAETLVLDDLYYLKSRKKKGLN